MKYNILILESEITLAENLHKLLKKQDIRIDVAYDGQYALNYIQSNSYNLVILDSALPVKSGLEVLMTFKDADVQVPILMLISKNEVRDAAQYLELGARECIVKPLFIKEFLDKARALLGIEMQKVISESIKYGDIELNLEQKLLVCAKRSVKLHLKEFQILLFLISNPEQILSKPIIIDKIWGEYSDLENNNVEVYFSLIRKKLQSIGTTTKIRTVRGVGYALTLNA